MTGRAIRRYQMLVRVSTFGAEHVAAFPIDTLAAQTFIEVQEAASQLEQHAVMQASARSRDRVHVKAAARSRLAAAGRQRSAWAPAGHGAGRPDDGRHCGRYGQTDAGSHRRRRR